MKIKILKTGMIVDAIMNHHNEVVYFRNRTALSIEKDDYEIIPAPPQPKFSIGQSVRYFDEHHFQKSFVIKSIIITAENHCIYCDGDHDFELSTGIDESRLALYTEPEKPKTYKYVECGQLNGEQIFEKVEE